MEVSGISGLRNDLVGDAWMAEKTAKGLWTFFIHVGISSAGLLSTCSIKWSTSSPSRDP